jgi:hypothetical protein
MGMEKIEESEYKYRTAYLIAFVFVLAMTLIDLALLICGLRGWVEISLLTAGKLFVCLLVLVVVTRLVWEFYDAQREAYQQFRSQTDA